MLNQLTKKERVLFMLFLIEISFWTDHISPIVEKKILLNKNLYGLSSFTGLMFLSTSEGQMFEHVCTHIVKHAGTWLVRTFKVNKINLANHVSIT